MNFPDLLIKETEDQFVQENFKRIREYFRGSATDRAGFEFLELTVPSGASSYPHKLGYVPKDIIVMHNSANVSVVFNYHLFTSTDIYLATGGATTLRILIGRYA
jgi:hypothetical protein